VSDVGALIKEWSARLGEPVTDAAVAEWLTARQDGANAMVRGYARDDRVGLLQLAVRSDRLETAILQLAEPVPLADLTSRFGPGVRWWAVDASSESIAWSLGATTITADIRPDQRVGQLSLARSAR
jgi:hypothetical protein